MKKSLLLLGLLLLPSSVFAGIGTPDPIFTDNGNKWRVRHVNISTQGAVILSSAPADSGLGIAEWRIREIVNLSTCCALGLYPSDTTEVLYFDTMSVTLSSNTTAGTIRTLGGSYILDHQAAVLGIWAPSVDGQSPGAYAVKKGALIKEQYQK